MTAPAPVVIREFDVAARSTDVFGRVLCTARNHHFIVDGPTYNNCPGEELTPPEIFLSSVAACGVELVHVIARETNVSIGTASCAIHGVVNRGAQPRADVTLFTTVTLDFTITGADDASAAALVEAFKRR